MTTEQSPASPRRTRGRAPDRRLVERLAVAMSTIDEHAVRDLLRPDVVLIVDGGGIAPAPSTPVTGRSAAASGLTAVAAPETAVTMASINGMPGLVLARGEVVIAAVTAEMRAGLLSTVWVVCNPEKLRHWNAG